MPRLRRLVFVGVAMLMSCAIAAGVVGFYLFTRPHVDPLAKADAIVVLGGEWDNRVAYGLDLARQWLRRHGGAVGLLHRSPRGHAPGV